MDDNGITYVKNEYKRTCETKVIGKLIEKKRKNNRLNYINAKNICFDFMKTGICSRGDSCRFAHDLEEYEKSKPPSLDIPCIELAKNGKCNYGILCRLNHENKNEYKSDGFVLNKIDPELRKNLNKRRYVFDKAMNILNNKENVLEKNLINKIDFNGKLYLAPLTTVGNLPFRRICKEFGADITCSEMILATSILQGKKGEWALVKRHSSEDIFGIQIAGSNSETIVKALQVIEENTKVDFIDLNAGCPIDLICNKGAGSSLLTNWNKLEKIVKSMIQISNVPITIKVRTGIKDNIKLTHKMVQPLQQLGISAITIHSRSKQQRYTKLADWSYIDECAKECDVDIIGNGDILSYFDVTQRLTDNISSIMIGRGALIKPWIFTEIKEKRIWDISANERLDIVKKYAYYGLEHWGSDSQGVEKTRMFLLEWLSFMYRYVPVGILENPPQQINKRPEAFYGRNELETLLSSPLVDDWIKISNMFLGPPPTSFHFIPKHNSNSYK